MKKETYMIQEALSMTFTTQAQSRVSTSKDIRIFNIQMKVMTSVSIDRHVQRELTSTSMRVAF